MKTIIKLKTILLLVFILALCAPAYAQPKHPRAKKPSTHSTTHKTKKAPQKSKSNKRTNTTYYKWPKEASHRITERVEEGSLGRTESIVRGAIRSQQSLRMYPVEMETFHFISQEQAFYEPELKAANSLFNNLRNMQVLTPANRARLENQLEAINDPSFKNILNEHLRTGNLSQMARDVSDYYGLDGDLVRSSYNYLLRYPHNPSLPYRRSLRNPLIDSELRATAARFLEKAEFTAEDQAYAYNVLSQMHTQRMLRTRAVEEVVQPAIEASVESYHNLAQALQQFIDTNHRLPDSRSTDPAEAQLCNDVNAIRFQQENPAWPPEIYQARATLEQTWQNGEIQKELQFYSRTYQALQEFVAAHGQRPKWNTLDPEEIQLYSDITQVQSHREYAAQHPALNSVFQQLEEVWQNSLPKDLWSYEEMLRRYEQHGIETGEWGYPASLRQNPNLTPEQVEFFDNVSYYIFADPKTLSRLKEIENKHKLSH